MTTRRNFKADRYAYLAVLCLAPLGLAAKGCNSAVVGDDGQCTEHCSAGEGNGESGASTGGGAAQGGGSTKGGSAGTGGSGVKGGTGGQAGSATGGTGGGSKGGTGAGGSGGTSGQKTCGGLLGSGCPDGQFCDLPPDTACGAADQVGTCTAIPELCPQYIDYVCGCDGITYSNTCAANTFGVSVAFEGGCPSNVGDECGGGSHKSCQADQFCDYPLDAQCGSTDGTGTCQPKPQACDDIYAPVCGCDGKTYASECTANSAGMGIISEGECASTVSCGGLQGVQCPTGSFCHFPTGAACGAADQTGTCETIPPACTKEYVPVCGCDGQTYGNECTANAAGVSVSATGECASGGDVCGGLTARACSKGQFCDYPLASQCGSGDMTGTCRTPPDGCTTDYAPVCGCDAKTYSNSCDAASNGIAVRATGECPKQ